MQIGRLEYNTATLPPSIYRYFCALGRERGDSGNLLPPFRAKFLFKENNSEYHCYILEEVYELFTYKLTKGNITDDKGKKLKNKDLFKILIPYAKGFNKGYSDFLNTISQNELFSDSDKDKAYKIFERVYRLFTGEQNNGGISYLMDFVNPKLQEYVTAESLYNNGYHGGEYYKAWELILKHPMSFKEFFDEKSNLEKEMEPPPPITLPSNIKEIFIDSEEKNYNKYLDLLKNATPGAVVGADLTYVLGPRSKTAITAWYTALKTKGKIKPLSLGALVPIFNSTFNGLNLAQDGKTLGDTTRTAYSKYYRHFLNEIN